MYLRLFPVTYQDAAWVDDVWKPVGVVVDVQGSTYALCQAKEVKGGALETALKRVAELEGQLHALEAVKQLAEEAPQFREELARVRLVAAEVPDLRAALATWMAEAHRARAGTQEPPPESVVPVEAPSSEQELPSVPVVPVEPAAQQSGEAKEGNG